jgi:hypothetical protein
MSGWETFILTSFLDVHVVRSDSPTMLLLINSEKEMAVMIAGRRFWLWRAVDDEGEVLDHSLCNDGATRLRP